MKKGRKHKHRHQRTRQPKRAAAGARGQRPAGLRRSPGRPQPIAVTAVARGRNGDAVRFALASLPLVFAAALLVPPDKQIWSRTPPVLATVPDIKMVPAAEPATLAVRTAGERVEAVPAPGLLSVTGRVPMVPASNAGAHTTIGTAQPPNAITLHAGTEVALIATAPEALNRSSTPAAALINATAPPLTSVLAEEVGPASLTSMCSLRSPPDLQLAATQATAMPRSPPETFPMTVPLGLRIARAARAQTSDLVIYNDRYFGLAYPLGDVPALYGVCTDVVVRALRAAGIDLQVLVRQARLGRGDASIDHRRTEVLRRYFERTGYGLPVTNLPEDYAAGDIVTYLRPQNPRVQSHIAVVSDVIGPSGRPMIVHNRGWGPQLEDALFADQISGHFRLHVSPPADAGGTPSAAAPASRPRPVRTIARSRPVKSAPVF